MQVLITLTGPQASGKSVLSDFIAEQLASRGLTAVTVKKGGQRGGPDHDTVTVQTSEASLRLLTGRDR